MWRRWSRIRLVGWRMLKSVGTMMHEAREGGYAVGYFESWNLESLQGVLDAAEKTRSPIIIGFNGEFLSGQGRVLKERLAIYGAMGLAAAREAAVPVGFVFNECSCDQWVEQAIHCGFNLVMPTDATASAAEYQDRVSRLVKLAHEHGVCVEAELGELPCGVGGRPQGGGSTESAQASRFVAVTGVDLLAVSVGNVHILTSGRTTLDLVQLAKLREAVSIPLVLHGGTGIADTDLKGAIEIGVTKVNYGTYLKQRYLTSLGHALTETAVNPHALLGMGGEKDLLVVSRQAICDAVLERIELLGCCGKADSQ